MRTALHEIKTAMARKSRELDAMIELHVHAGNQIDKIIREYETLQIERNRLEALEQIEVPKLINITEFIQV